MKRPYLTYLLAVVLPAALAVMVTVRAANDAWGSVANASDVRVGRMVLGAFEQDLGRTVDSLLAAAAPTAGMDTTDAAVARALAGDTVTGMRSVAGAEIFAVRGPDEGDPAGSVRLATGAFPGRAAREVGRATGYATALYLNGVRVGAEAPGPERLDPETLSALGQAPGAVAAGTDATAGVFVALGGPETPSISLVAFAAPRAADARLVPLPLLLVMGLLLLFATLAGWIQITGHPRAASNPASLILLSLVPALTAGAFLVQVGRAFSERTENSLTKDLTRGLAVASVRRVTGSPTTVHRLTGFDATLVRNGRIVVTSAAAAPEALATLPAPPGSFTTSGRLSTSDGGLGWVALRAPDGGFIVATAPDAAGPMAALRMRTWAIAGVLAGWLLLVGVLIALRWKRAAAAPPSEEPSRRPAPRPRPRVSS